jgi:hypothetical protein
MFFHFLSRPWDWSSLKRMLCGVGWGANKQKDENQKGSNPRWRQSSDGNVQS